MPAKKPTRVKSSARAKRPMGLTSAIGPKATTMVVIGVMAGGILVAARQQSRPKDEMRAQSAAELSATPGSPSGLVLAQDPRPAAFTSRTGSAASPTANGATAAATVRVPPVTVTGCLERSGDTFRLKDTTGDAAPRSRSWKSGFLRKGAASIDIVDAGHGLALANHVGERVSLTGALVDREMQARTLRRLATSCEK